MTSSARILILDGHSSASLAFVRSLGRAGYWVMSAATIGVFSATAQSRFCRAHREYPNPLDDVEEFVSAIRKIVQEYSIDLVVPMTDATVWPIAQAQGEFGVTTKLATPSRESIELVSDKYQTVVLAEKLGVPTPRTILLRADADLMVMEEWSYPVVIKDRFSIKWKNGKGVSGGVAFAYTFNELLAKVEMRLAKVDELLVQEFFSGDGIGFSCFAAGGKFFHPFEWLRLREKDPRGSGSSARKSIPLDENVERFSRELLLLAQYQGIAMVEFKRHRQTGALTLMEINGRPWGSIQLPIHCGIDYPLHLVRWCLGGTLPHEEKIEYKEQITCRWLVADMIHLENLWSGKPDGWPESFPNFWFNLVKVLLPWYPSLRHDHFAWDDPKPGLVDFLVWLDKRFIRNA